MSGDDTTKCPTCGRPIASQTALEGWLKSEVKRLERELDVARKAK